MRSIKQSILFSFLVFLFSAISAIAQSTEDSPANTAPDVDSIMLNRSVVYLSCAKGESAPAECSDSKAQYIEVNTTVSDKENNTLLISYQVTDGRIVGQGRKVFWYLGGAKQGVHTITAIVDDGGGPKGRRVTKEIEVKSCPVCRAECDCPRLEVTASSKSVFAGDLVTFSVAAADGFSRKYVWSISAGRILSGQDTSTIRVQTDSLSPTLLTAAVENDQNRCNCENGVSETIEIKRRNSNP